VYTAMPRDYRHLWWRVRGQERWTSRSGNPQFQGAFLWKAGLYRIGQKTSLATCETVMMVRKQNSTKSWRRIEQRSSNSSDENGNHSEETQHGPSLIPPNIAVRQEYGKERNKWIWWSQKERKKCCGVSCASKTRQKKTIRKHMNYEE
jgi:hypothetical protein